MDEHRVFTRINRHIEVDVTGGGATLACQTRDISLNGLFAEAPSAPASLVAGTVVTVLLHVDGRGGVLAVQGRGSVVRRLPAGLAIHLDELIEIESYDILKNLILYHAADPAKAESEFASHIGLRPLPD